MGKGKGCFAGSELMLGIIDGTMGLVFGKLDEIKDGRCDGWMLVPCVGRRFGR